MRPQLWPHPSRRAFRAPQDEGTKLPACSPDPCYAVFPARPSRSAPLTATAAVVFILPHEHRDPPLPTLVAHLLNRWPVRFTLIFHRSRAAIAGGLDVSCVAFPRQVS